MKKIIIAFAFFLYTESVSAQIVALTIGPMFSLHIGANTPRWSYGFEGAVYFQALQIPYLQSIDFGLEKHGKSEIIYSEFQLARLFENMYLIPGFALGVFHQFNEESESRTGVQATIWGAYFLGIDARFRYTPKMQNLSIGGFGKFVLPLHSYGH